MKKVISILVAAAILGIIYLGVDNEEHEDSKGIEAYMIPTPLKTWGNQTYCRLLENATEADMCFLDAAYDERNASLCSEIGYENLNSAIE
jgi:hypothetical protein